MTLILLIAIAAIGIIPGFLLGEHLGHKRGSREAYNRIEKIKETSGPVIRALAEKDSCE